MGLACQLIHPARTFRSVHSSYFHGIVAALPYVALSVLTHAISQYGSRPWYRHVCAIGAVLNILLMMFANLVGFVIGTDGVQFFVTQLFGTLEGMSCNGMPVYVLMVILTIGFRFLAGASFCMFVGAQLMFEYR
jgi:D-alanyl-lipoteichoic acid acyltransferase DltB (MBOAT superfamily)